MKQIDIIDTINPSFYLSAELEKIVIGDFLEIGGTYNRYAKRVEGSAKFVVDYETVPFKLFVDIEAAIFIPILKTFGRVDIEVNEEGARLEGEISFLDGLLNPYAVIKWDWEFTYFYAELGNIIFAPFVLELKNLVLDIDTREGGLTMRFAIQITVLSFADLEASLEIEERGDALYASFELVVDLELIKTTVSGSATLAHPIQDSDFGSFDVAVEPGGAAVAVAKWVGDATQAVADGINTAIKHVENAVKEIGRHLKNIIGKLGFIADAWSGFGSGVNSLLSGDVGAFAASMAKSFNQIFKPENWENVGNAVLDSIGQLADTVSGWLASSSSTWKNTYRLGWKHDQWGCDYIRTIVKRKRCWGYRVWGRWIGHCQTTTISDKELPDESCVEKNLKLYNDAKANLNTAGAYGNGISATKAGNKGLLTADLKNMPEPQISDITGTVAYNEKPGWVKVWYGLYSYYTWEYHNPKPKLVTTISGTTRILDNQSLDGYSNSGTSFSTSAVELDFSGSDEDFSLSLDRAISKTREKVKDTLTKDQTSEVDHSVKQFSTNPAHGAVELDPLEIHIPAVRREIQVSCSNMQAILSKEKPVVDKSDVDCGSKTYLLSFSDGGLSKSRLGVTIDPAQLPADVPCGTATIERKYKVNDKCGRSSEAQQTIYVKPEAPIFTIVPESTVERTFSTSIESLEPANMGDNWPTVESCGDDVYNIQLHAFDAHPLPLPNECGMWRFRRIWRAFLDFGPDIAAKCQARGLESSPEAHAIQQFDLKDDEAPEFIEVPEQGLDLHIPFFDNSHTYNPNAPLILDIATNLEAREWGLAAGGVTLTSMDSKFVWMPTNNIDEASCRDSGIAQFKRTWTASDKCGNSKTKTQMIILDHPPVMLTATDAFNPFYHSFAPGVTQSTDPCFPGKLVALGEKFFAADFNFNEKKNICDPEDPTTWDENGCRLEESVVDKNIEIMSVKPKFDTFPDDITILTDTSLDPENTGIPVGRAFCSTPYEILHVDESAVLTAVDGCGMRTINRHWYTRPVYEGCHAVTDTRLITERVQMITVKDVCGFEN